MTRKRIEVVDASVLIDVINIPMEAHDHEAVIRELDLKADAGVLLILPIAAVVETAQHVQRIENGADRRRCAENLQARVVDTLQKKLPWHFVPTAWDDQFLTDFFRQTPPYPLGLVETLSQRVGEAGDLLLISEFRRLRTSYTQSLFDVDIWTQDRGLRIAADWIRGASQ
jgi:hypothetical protein